MDNTTNYIEVSPTSLTSNRWREIVLDTGSSQSTLQDFKLPEVAGGFTYKDNNSWANQSCNRFIYWKATNDILELTELSLDYNLTGNQLRLKFQKTPVLEGISVHETIDKIYILVATVGSVHRLSFPHPKKLILDLSRPSIFAHAYSEQFNDPINFTALNSSGNLSVGMPIPITSCSWLTSDNREAVFVIANSAGSLLVVRLGSSKTDSGKAISWELKQTTIMERLWNGLVPSIIRGTQEGDEAAVSLVSHAIQNDCLILALCKDLRIRIWSYNRQECLLIHYILGQHNYSNDSLKAPSLTVRRPVVLKKWVSQQQQLFIAAFIAGNEQKQFFVYELVESNGTYNLKNQAIINSPEIDLIDFCLSDNQIYSLWLNSESSFSVLHCSMQSSPWDWKQVALHSQFTQNTYVNSLLVDPRELYIEDIFWSGKFSLQTISKAISIMSRIPQSFFANTRLDLLVNEAIKIVENKIRSHVGVSELSPEEYNEIVLETWGTLYSYCDQYNNLNNKPHGIFTDSNAGFIGIIKKANFSMLRKTDQIDTFIINSIFGNSIQHLLSSVCDASIASSFNELLRYVNVISQCLSQDDTLRFENDLSRGEKVEKIALGIVEGTLLAALDPFSPNNDPLKRSFDNFYTKIPHLIDALDIVLAKLNLSSQDNQASDADLDEFFQMSNELSISAFLISFLSSQNGVSIVTESVKQLSRLRFNFLRNLLLLETFITKLRSKDDADINQVVEGLHSKGIPQTAQLLQAYYFMTWVCETPMILDSNVSTEETSAQLSLLELNEYINVNRSHHSSPFHYDNEAKTILNHFILNQGGVLAKKLLSAKLKKLQDNQYEQLWGQVLPIYINSVAQVIWPFSNQIHIAEFLLGFGQNKLLERYVLLLDVWCPTNTFTRQFLKGFNLLVNGEPEKSAEFFIKAVLGFPKETFLNKILKIQYDESQEYDDENFNELSSDYIYKFYNKLIQMFKIYNYSESIIELANSSLLLLDENSENYQEQKSSLYSTLFMSHLELGNTNEAYESMMLIPDLSQQKICLRKFVVDHCENGKVGDLILFSYKDIEEEFVNIIESRARSTDLLLSNENNYYHVLYSYYIEKKNYRKAASVMYEYGKRLSIEVPGIESISKQVSCYMITLNCLKIVNPTYSWIVKPSTKRLPSESITISDQLTNNSKRNHLGNEIESESESENGLTHKLVIDVVDIDEIKKDYELVNARLKLLKKDPKLYNIANTPLTAPETVIHLVAASLFDVAFHICKMLKMSYQDVFYGIVSKYIHLVNSNSSYEIFDLYNNCFIDNQTVVLGYINSADLSPFDKMWHLINAYLERYEQPGQTQMHKCVTEKLLEAGLPLPTLLKIRYQKINCCELLHLLMTYDYIEDAATLAIEQINAFLGKGTDNFDISSNLILPNQQPLYVPYHQYHALVEILQNEQDTLENFKKLSVKLNDELKKLEKALLQRSRKHESLPRHFKGVLQMTS